MAALILRGSGRKNFKGKHAYRWLSVPPPGVLACLSNREAYWHFQILATRCWIHAVFGLYPKPRQSQSITVRITRPRGILINLWLSRPWRSHFLTVSPAETWGLGEESWWQMCRIFRRSCGFYNVNRWWVIPYLLFEEILNSLWYLRIYYLPITYLLL